MQQPRDIKQSTVRGVLQSQDEQILEQNGYNHSNFMQVNQNGYPPEAYQDQNNQMKSSGSTSVKSQYHFEINSVSNNEGRTEQTKSSADKQDIIPNEVIEVFKTYKNMKKQSVRALLKKWNLKCKEEENKMKNSVKQYHKRQEVERRSLFFSKIQDQFYSQNKIKTAPSQLDFAFFIGSLNCYDSTKNYLRLVLDEQTEMMVNQSDEQQNNTVDQLFFITLRNKTFAALQELSLQIAFENFHNQQFFDKLVLSLDFQNLKYLQISFINTDQNPDTHLCLKGASLSSLSYRLKVCCPDLSYLVLGFQEVDLDDNDFLSFTNNILQFKNLFFIDLCFRNTTNITTNDITTLLRGLTLNKKTHIELSFIDAQYIQINDELFHIVSSILDIPEMYYLKSLCLNFPVIFPPEKEHLQKQIMMKMNELFNKTPFLNNLKLFVPLHQNTERLIYLKSFNYQKIWVQLLKIRKLGLLNKFRKEISWELCDFQELFIF